MAFVTARRALVAALLVVLGGACGDSEPVTDPADAGSCAELVEAGMGAVQDMLDAVADLSLADIEALGEDQPPAFDELAERSAELEARGDELGCTPEELEAEFAERVGDLDADGPFAQLILDGMERDGFGFGG